jgi:hypothetical protein
MFNRLGHSAEPSSKSFFESDFFPHQPQSYAISSARRHFLVIAARSAGVMFIASLFK